MSVVSIVFSASIFVLSVAVAYRIATSCRHQWEVIDKVRIYSADDINETVGYKRVQQCKKCGKLDSSTT